MIRREDVAVIVYRMTSTKNWGIYTPSNLNCEITIDNIMELVEKEEKHEA